MHSIEVVLAMLLAVVGSGYLVRVVPISLPLPLIQIALGAVIAGVFGHGVVLDPEIFFLLFLPPLLFLDGWRIPKVGLFRDKAVILELAFGLVVFTVIGAGFLIHWLIPAMPLPVAFALAAILSPTDPVAVSSIAARAPIPKRLMHILEGESLLNDASGLVCFRFAVAAAMTGSFSLASASVTFLWVAFGGLAIGVGATWGISLAQRWLSRQFGEESGSPILVSLLIPFGAYLAAEHLQASGILAAVAAGITMSYVELSGRALATTRVQRAAVWDMLQFSLNGIMFVLLGEQLPGILRGAVATVEETGHLNPWWLAVYALVIMLVLALLRFAWVWVSLRWSLFRAYRRGESLTRPDVRLLLATSLAGVRGAITLAGVLTLPLMLPDGSPFPARDLAIFLAAAVILVSLVAASIGLPRLLRGLELPDEPAERREEDFARREAAAAAIAAVEKARHGLCGDSAIEADLYTNAAVRVMANYQHRLEDGNVAGVDAARLRQADQAEVALRLAGLQAEREAIFRLARRGQISDEISRKLVRQIDLVESRYR
ncbi:Na+/H+ antiporter [Azoarcus indigens]|uniref:Sodium/proton antiporter (CPA1 family) n=1 Tax=Azoarcus indigens TaxID=29545 RepID=A0A4R6DWP8_9RHOO|nr:Na+/H+ antiporter [Azoarcus indigens]NMG67703.1 Na+/H+ antiporter [Azoarcus indigens]TDN49653.1 sodium/proton antiporter (CPA1 family) [Azoarcus indigens]